MGYTHSFKQTRAFDDDEWTQFKSEVSQIFPQLPEISTSSGGLYNMSPLELKGYKPPKPGIGTEWTEFKITKADELFSEDDVEYGCDAFVIQGWGVELDHETAVFTKGLNPVPLSDFCKTERKPYDFMVIAALLLLHNMSPDLYEIDSDGDIKDWEPVHTWLETTLGRSLEYPPNIIGGAPELPSVSRASAGYVEISQLPIPEEMRAFGL